MCAPRSVYPWDIIIIREGDHLILDKRDGGPFGKKVLTNMVLQC
jgi:translation initiation factor 3 subunit D